MSQYKAILDQIEQLKRQAEDVRREEMAGAIAEIRRLMGEFGITMADLDDTRPSRTRTRARADSVGQARYRDPASGKTWTGRGRRPAWVVDLEAQGRSVEEYRIA